MQLPDFPGAPLKEKRWEYGSPVKVVYNVACTATMSENTRGKLYVFTDITSMYLANEQLRELNSELALKRLEADEKNNAKSDFLANMSHEIRTPMNGVIGMTSLLASTVLSNEQQDYVDTIRMSGETLLSLINDLLDFSKIEAGKMELEQNTCSIGAVIEETYDLLSVKANEKNLDLLYMIEPDVPAEILSDVTRLRQVLSNLVSNGIKFTEKGEILIEVSVLEKKEDWYTFEITVKDTGIGIPREKQHKLFQNFSQVDTSTTRKYGGTGLGLAISQKIIHLMGGTIRVESEMGKGASFIFNFVAQANRQVKQYSGKQENVILKGKKILILDDNLTNLKILKAQCEMWEMNAHTFTSPTLAIDALAREHYHIAIIDMVIHNTNGVEVAERIKQRFPGITIPLVLFSSAGYSPLDEPRYKDLFAATLYKPTRHQQIRKTITDILSRQTSRRKKNVIEPITIIENPNPLRILVAEDNDINQKLIRRALEKLGYTCDIVFNGKEVLRAAEAMDYDIVFMDILMPEMDGYRATEELFNLLRGRNMPVIIAMTANAMEEDRKKALDTGMNDYISKPFKMEEIKAKLDKWFPNI
jgi:signal transduction histidine kinase/DNA-binding response OmpR family regulator